LIKAGLFHLLSTTSAITTICDTRIYPDVRPTGPEYPLIEYKEISSISNPTWDTSGMQRDRYQFDCCAASSLGAEQLREALRQTLNGYQGVLSDGTYLQYARLITRTSSYSDMPRIYCATIEFYLLYNFTN
jgi:Protein of unknown function (DUF3168)